MVALQPWLHYDSGHATLPTLAPAGSAFGPAAVLVAAAPARWAIVAVFVMEFIDSVGIGLHVP